MLAARWLGLEALAGGFFLLDTATVSVLSHHRGIPAIKRWNAPRRRKRTKPDWGGRGIECIGSGEGSNNRGHSRRPSVGKHVPKLPDALMDADQPLAMGELEPCTPIGAPATTCRSA